jgi:hypothetical protein
LGKAYSLPKREKNRLFNRTLFLANAINKRCKVSRFFLMLKLEEVSQRIEQPRAGVGGAINPDGSKIAM